MLPIQLRTRYGANQKHGASSGSWRLKPTASKLTLLFPSMKAELIIPERGKSTTTTLLVVHVANLQCRNSRVESANKNYRHSVSRSCCGHRHFDDWKSDSLGFRRRKTASGFRMKPATHGNNDFKLAPDISSKTVSSNTVSSKSFHRTPYHREHRLAEQ